MNVNQCNSKRFYDTEWEADRAANIASYDFQAEMVSYRCGRHWHIANKQRKLRSKVRPFNRTYCEACNTYMRPSRYRTHITLAAHQARARRLEVANMAGINQEGDNHSHDRSGHQSDGIANLETS